MKKFVFVIVSFFLLFNDSKVILAMENNRPQEQEELKSLRSAIIDSVNNNKFEDLIPYLHKNFVITMIDQKTLKNVSQFKEYFKNLLHSKNAILAKIIINPKGDGPPVFFGEKVAFNTGSSSDTYITKSGHEVVIDTRWTSTLLKENGKWKLFRLHAGGDILDNPLINAAKENLYIFGGVGIAIGFIVGFFIAKVGGSRKKQTA